MKTSESIKELATALCKAQAAMGAAEKGSANPFFKSKYADLMSVITAIKLPFSENGLSFTQFPITIGESCSGQKSKLTRGETVTNQASRLTNLPGKWVEYEYTFFAGVTTRLMHSSGEWIESEYTLPIVKKDPQSVGSAITYARRYALQSISGLPTADDDAEIAMGRNIDASPAKREKFNRKIDLPKKSYSSAPEDGKDVIQETMNELSGMIDSSATADELRQLYKAIPLYFSTYQGTSSDKERCDNIIDGLLNKCSYKGKVLSSLVSNP
jgi:hypothetical protein